MYDVLSRQLVGRLAQLRRRRRELLVVRLHHAAPVVLAHALGERRERELITNTSRINVTIIL